MSQRWSYVTRPGAALGAVLFILTGSGAANTGYGGAAPPQVGASSLSTLLTEFETRNSIRLIYNSQIIENISIDQTPHETDDIKALKNVLQNYGVATHKIGSSTYALTLAPTTMPEPIVPDSRPEKTSDHLFDDVILVTSQAGSGTYDLTSPNLLSLDREHPLLFDIASPADAIEELPNAVASFTPANTGFRGSTGGVYFPDLNGFGPERTLVLVNGRKRTQTPGGTTLRAGVDLNAIAEPFLERIEIITGVNGAQFDEDAIGGIINFDLRTDFEGFEAGARAAISEQGDAIENSAYFLAGKNLKGGDGRMMLGVYHSSSDGLLGRERVSDGPYGFAADGVQQFGPTAEFLPGFGGSQFTPQGSVVGARLADGSIELFPEGAYSLSASGGASLFEGRPDQLYDWSPEIHFIAPVERLIATLDTSINLSDSVVAYAAGSFANTWSEISAAPLPGSFASGTDPDLGNAFTVSLTHPSIPQGIRDLYDQRFPDAESLILERRFSELGPRIQDIERRYIDIAAGLQLRPSDNVDIHFGYRFGRSNVADTRRNTIDRARLKIALSPEMCAATPACVSPDFFGDGISNEFATFIRAAPVTRSLSLSEHEFDISASFELSVSDADTIHGALSTRVEWEKYQDFLETPATDIIGINLNNNNRQTLRRSRFSASADVPIGSIIANDPSLRLKFASTLHESSRNAPFVNTQTALLWTPTSTINLHGQYFAGKRAPNAVEFFDRPQSFFRGFLDPCDTANGMFSENVAENCLSGGELTVGPDHRQTVQIAALGGFSDPDLQPERVRSVSAGFSVTSPQMLNDSLFLKLAASWQRTIIREMIYGNPDALTDCYQSPDLASPACGVNPETNTPLIRRNALSGQIESLTVLLTNRGTLRRDNLSLDANIEWRPPSFSPVSRLWLAVSHNYLFRAAYSEPALGVTETYLGDLDNPVHATLLTGGVELGSLTTIATVNRRGAVRTADIPHPAAQIGAYTIADISMKYRIDNDISITLGVKNVMDRQTPIAAFGILGGYFPQYYDITGRQYSLSLRALF